MIKIEFSLFCRLQWKYIERTIIADSTEDAMVAINEEYPIEFRGTPFDYSNKDSLKIISSIEEKYFILE